MTTETPRRPLLHPTNVRFAVMLLLISFVVIGGNLCTGASIVRGVVRSEPVARLPKDLSAMRSEVEGLSGAVGRVSAEVGRLTSQELRVVYMHDPSKETEPPAKALEGLRALVAAGAELRVVRRPIGSKGPITSVNCAAAVVDSDGNVLCSSHTLPANFVLPDGRRYQETVRHDGTVLFAHWDSNGGNVQGNREIARYATTWLARGPIR